MINFEKANLITVSKEDVEAGSKAILINDMCFVIDTKQKTPSTDSVEYYKCEEVLNSSTDLIVSNAGTTEVNGRYKLNEGTSGDERIWTHVDNDQIIIYKDLSYGWSILNQSLPVPNFPLYNAPDASEPWDATYQKDPVGIGVALNPVPTVTLTPSENSWSGYKAVLVEEEIPGEVSSTNLIVSNATINPNVNGKYVKEDNELSEYYYKHTEKNLRLYKSGQVWYIEDIDSMAGIYNDGRGENGTEVSDPTLITTWYNAAGVELSDTITIKWKTSEAKTVKYYKFEEILTEGLTYGNGFTPEADNVYDSNAMVKVNLYQKTT